MDKKKIEKAIYEILVAIGENPKRKDLLDTPKRVAEMYEEIFSGIKQNPEDELEVIFLKSGDRNMENVKFTWIKDYYPKLRSVGRVDLIEKIDSIK